MFSSAKLPTLWPILCFFVVASAGFAAPIDLPENTIVIEAEDGEIDAGVKVIEEAGIGGGKALNHDVGMRTMHELDFPKAGKWYVWVRMFTPGADSTWIGMDPPSTPNPHDQEGGEGAIKIFSNVGDSVNPVFLKNPGKKTNDACCNVWFWDTGTQDFHGQVSFFEVPQAGKYTFWIKGREPGTLVDQVLLTIDPNFNAEKATEGNPIDIAALNAVSPKDNLTVTWGTIKVSR